MAWQVLCVAVALAWAGHAAAADQLERTNKVLIIGVDGVFPPALERASTPNFDRLIANGCYTMVASTGDITVSGPGWSSILCGVWRDKHNVPDNDFRRPNYDQYPSLFTLAKRVRPELKTASFISWMPIHNYTLFDEAMDHKVAHDYEAGGDDRNTEAAEVFLASADTDLVFFYFSDVDSAGHSHGFHPDVPEYLAEIEEVDGQIGRLLGAIRKRPNYEQEDWLILSTTDHGGTLDGSHGRNEPKHREIYFLVSGDSAARGEMRYTVNQVDIVPTALDHLGIEADPAWGLDGRVVGGPPASLLDRNLVFNGDAEYSTGYDNLELDSGIAGWRDWSNMTVLRYGSPEGYPTTQTPGSPSRGRQFFVGGREGDSTISQRIDVTALTDDIDRGHVRFEFEAWLGGFADQRDLASVIARFLDDDGNELGRSRLAPVTLSDRQVAFAGQHGEATGFLHRHRGGGVPAQTRVVQIVLHAEVGAGSNDGCADDISIVLKTK